VASTAEQRLGGRPIEASDARGDARLAWRARASAVAFGFVAVATAVLAKLAVFPSAPLDRLLLLLGGVVLASGWYGGARAGIPATLFGVAAAVFFSLAPAGGGVDTSQRSAIALFFGGALFITGLCEHARNIRRRAEERSRRATRELSDLRAADLASRRMAAGLTALSRLGTALGAGLEPREVAMLAAEGALSVSGAGWVALHFDRYGAGAEPIRVGIGLPDLAGGAPLDRELLHAALGASGLLRAGDARRHGLLASLSTRRHPVRSVLLARVDGHSGTGALYLGHPEPDAFDERHERLLGVLAVQTASALDNAHHHADAQQALATAQIAGRMKDEFLSTLSHELRTPLSAIMGWAHLLQGRRLGPDDTHRAIETIVRNASLQERMIGELLDMSSLLNGCLRLAVAPVDLRGVVEDAVTTGRAYARAKGVDLRLASPTSAIAVLGDATRLQQVVWSLLSNAIKFTPAGGRVRVQVAPAKPHAQIVVSDTGSGLDPELLTRLFSRFSRADASSTRPTRGLGLGLAVARGLVELHDGQLAAESPGPGQGSTFTVRLPLLPTQVEGPPLTTVSRVQEGVMLGGGSAA
jgi:signal transduction histidine kinase